MIKYKIKFILFVYYLLVIHLLSGMHASRVRSARDCGSAGAGVGGRGSAGGGFARGFGALGRALGDRAKQKKRLVLDVEALRQRAKKRTEVAPAELRKRLDRSQVNYRAEMNKIMDESAKSFERAYTKINRKWLEKTVKRLGLGAEDEQRLLGLAGAGPRLITGPAYAQLEPLIQALAAKYGDTRTTVVPEDFYTPLDVGDCVSLISNLQQSNLFVIVELPSRTDDPRYTLMDQYGQLEFVDKSDIAFRVPSVFPHGYFGNCIYQVPEPKPGYGSVKPSRDKSLEAYIAAPTFLWIVARVIRIIAVDSWRYSSMYNVKLDLLYKLLAVQNPHNISIFTMLDLLEHISAAHVDLYRDQLHSADALLHISQQVQPAFAKILALSNLGKQFEPIRPTNYDITKLLGLHHTIRRQKTCWSFPVSNNATKFPLMVNIMPPVYSSRIETVCSELSNDAYITEFVKSVKHAQQTSNLRALPPYFDDVLFLLKEYAIGNISDPKSETFATHLMKLLTPHDNVEITKTDIYNFLVDLGYIEANSNPTHFRREVALPYKNVSRKSDTEQDYYQLWQPDASRDCSAGKRVDYTDHRVYCIDSESAHEIDDGISMKKLDDHTGRVFVHIADPTSYLDKNDTLVKIAYERAATNYQPEFALGMLPKSIINVAGLGIDGLKTRALTFSVNFNWRSKAIDFDTINVEASYISKFPKYTYNDVDRTLKANEDRDFNKLSVEEQELKYLYDLSYKLQRQRISKGAILFEGSMKYTARFNEQTTIENLNLGEVMEDEDVALSIQKNSKSTVLVSEIMILANMISAQFLVKNKLAGMFKGMYQLPFSGAANDVFKNLNKKIVDNRELLSAKEFISIFKFISPAFFTSEPQRHFMVGADAYAPSTSPLRRFCDIINHFQFHSMINGTQPVFSKDEARSIALHLDYKNSILQQAQNMASNYYLINDVKKNLQDGTLDNIEVADFVVISRQRNGYVNGVFVKGGLFAKMKIILNKSPPQVGVIHKNFKFTKLDVVGNEIVLEETAPQA